MVLEALLSFFIGKKTSSTVDKEKKHHYITSSPSAYSIPVVPQVGFDLVSSQFHFPVRYSKFAPSHQIEQEIDFLNSVFNETSLGGLTLTYFRKVLHKTCHLPKFMSSIVFRKLIPADQDPSSALITKEPFMSWWNHQIQPFSSELRFFNILKADPSRDFLTIADLRPFLTELVQSCQALEFLRTSPIFQARYLDTVLAVYMYKNDRHRTGQISFDQFRKSKLVEIFKRIEGESDVSALQNYFSYKNFYVIYRKFWELDTDHDMQLSIGDLSRYGNASLSTRALRRIFQHLQGPEPSAIPKHHHRQTQNQSRRSDNSTMLIDIRMSFSQFVWFILSEEDKTTEHSWRYWFNVADRDDDGLISAYDIEYFYEEQTQRQRNFPQYDHQEAVNFQDIFHQLTDIYGDISISFVQICQSGQAEMFFNLLFNLPKFLHSEYSNPFESGARRAPTNPWDLYVSHEYSIASLEDSLSRNPSGSDDGPESFDSSDSPPTSIDPEDSDCSESTSEGEPDPVEQVVIEEERDGLSSKDRDESVDELLWVKRLNHRSSISVAPSSSPKRTSPTHAYTML